jgi:putative lipoic acid-binding regulatory protein
MRKQVDHGGDKAALKIEFPCENYSIRVLGRKTDDYSQWVIDCVQRQAPDLDSDKVEVIDSRNGRFQSVYLRICAQSVEQLQAIHTDLISSGRVQIVI